MIRRVLGHQGISTRQKEKQQLRKFLHGQFVVVQVYESFENISRKG